MQAAAQRHLSLLRFGAEPSPARRPLSPSSHSALLQEERRQIVADELEYSLHPRTHANYQRANSQFTLFLQSIYGSSDYGWTCCRPDDVCLFIRRSLLPNLTGRDGGDVASSTLQGWVSALGRCFDQRGRDCDWCNQTASGNPVRSGLVRSALRNFQQRQIRDGRRPRSAVPMLPQNIAILAERMDQALSVALQAQHSSDAALLLRDLAFILCMWNGGRRGQDILYIDWDDLYLQAPDRAVTSATAVWSQCPLPQDAQVCGLLLIVPCRTKTEHTRRPQTQEIRPNARSDLCAIRRLRTFFRQQQQLHQRIPAGAVFRSTRAPFDRLTAPAAGARVRANLVKYGTDHGETMHSFRRGHIQAAQATAEPTQVTMQRAGISSGGTFQKYADRGRHLR